MPAFLAYYNAAIGEQIALTTAGLVILFMAGEAAFRRFKPWHSYLQRKPILTAASTPGRKR